jgi:hypothetical protein
MAHLRIALLATLCAAIMCVAGAVQLFGVNRIVVDDGQIPAAATSLTGTVDVGFKSETFPLER